MSTTPMTSKNDNAPASRTDKAVVCDALVRRLDAAYADLVYARKIAALEKHESYEEIGDAIKCVEAAFVWLHKSPNAPIRHEGA